MRSQWIRTINATGCDSAHGCRDSFEEAERIFVTFGRGIRCIVLDDASVAKPAILTIALSAGVHEA